MPIIEPTCDNPDELLAWPSPGPIDHIQVERSATGGGAGYSNIGSLALAAGQRTYAFYDANGGATDWYRWYFSNAANTFPTAGNRQYSDELQVAALDAYASTAMLRSFVRNKAATDAADPDTELARLALETSARAIDRYCRRSFRLAADLTTRYFSPRYLSQRERFVVDIDDVFDLTGMVVTYDTTGNGDYTQATTAYHVLPRNAPSVAMPYRRILFNLGEFMPPLVTEEGVSVLARWGWPSFPAAAVDANLLQAARLLKRRDATFGIAGSPDMGNEIRLLAKLDPDVEVMLEHYKIYEIG